MYFFIYFSKILFLTKIVAETLATTGHVFSAKVHRKYISDNNPGNSNLSLFDNKIKNYSQCNFWGVVTTIFKPSEAMKKYLFLPEKYCLVIVSDIKTPKKEYSEIMKNSKVFFMSVEFQNRLKPFLSFSKLMPWNHFSRKNIGFLFFISANASAIFDFDDDNIITSLNEF